MRMHLAQGFLPHRATFRSGKRNAGPMWQCWDYQVTLAPKRWRQSGDPCPNCGSRNNQVNPARESGVEAEVGHIDPPEGACDVPLPARVPLDHLHGGGERVAADPTCERTDIATRTGRRLHDVAPQAAPRAEHHRPHRGTPFR
jgi:hypothetical protein